MLRTLIRSTNQRWSALRVPRHLSNKSSFDWEKLIKKVGLRWIRDHCKCPECFNKATNQRLFSPRLTKSHCPRIASMKKNNGELFIEWEDGHQSIYAENEFSKKLAFGSFEEVDFPTSYVRENLTLWDGHEAADLPNRVAYTDFMECDDELFRALLAFLRYGFVLVTECPRHEEKEVGRMAERIGPMRSTLFSTGTWNFNSKPNEIKFADMAYSARPLDSHTDGCYYWDSPMVQGFYCLHNKRKGALTLLVDGFQAAANLRRDYPNHYKFLTDTPIPYRYKGDGFNLVTYAPVIRHSYYGHSHAREDNYPIEQIRFNNEDRASLCTLGSSDKIEQFYEAFGTFSEIIKAPRFEYAIELSPGNLLLVNNWRVFHGRSKVEGERKIAGFYMDRDYIMSRVRVLRDAKSP